MAVVSLFCIGSDKDKEWSENIVRASLAPPALRISKTTDPLDEVVGRLRTLSLVDIDDDEVWLTRDSSFVSRALCRGSRGAYCIVVGDDCR